MVAKYDAAQAEQKRLRLSFQEQLKQNEELQFNNFKFNERIQEVLEQMDKVE